MTKCKKRSMMLPEIESIWREHFSVETIGKIWRWHRVDKLSISKIAKRLAASRNTIAKYLGGEVTQSRYKQRPKRAPVMGTWMEQLEAMLAADAQRPRKEQRTTQRLLDGLAQDGFAGSYPTVQRFVKARQYHRKFLQMASHYLIEPVASAPAGRCSKLRSARCWCRWRPSDMSDRRGCT